MGIPGKQNRQNMLCGACISGEVGDTKDRKIRGKTLCLVVIETMEKNNEGLPF
jgi:hypothetical protein